MGRREAPAPVEIDRGFYTVPAPLEGLETPPVIVPAPWPELNLEPFPESETQRLAAWQAVGMAQQILPEREAYCAGGSASVGYS